MDQKMVFSLLKFNNLITFWLEFLELIRIKTFLDFRNGFDLQGVN